MSFSGSVRSPTTTGNALMVTSLGGIVSGSITVVTVVVATVFVVLLVVKRYKYAVSLFPSSSSVSASLANATSLTKASTDSESSFERQHHCQHELSPQQNNKHQSRVMMATDYGATTSSSHHHNSTSSAAGTTPVFPPLKERPQIRHTDQSICIGGDDQNRAAEEEQLQSESEQQLQYYVVGSALFAMRPASASPSCEAGCGPVPKKEAGVTETTNTCSDVDNMDDGIDDDDDEDVDDEDDGDSYGLIFRPNGSEFYV